MDLDLYRAKRLWEWMDQLEVGGAMSVHEANYLLEVLGVLLEPYGVLEEGDRRWLDRMYHRVQKSLPVPPLMMRRAFE